MKEKQRPALGARARDARVARGSLRTIPPVKKVSAGALKTACPPPCRIFSPQRFRRSGVLPGVEPGCGIPPSPCPGPPSRAGECAGRSLRGFLPSGLPPPDFTPRVACHERVDGADSSGRPEESRAVRSRFLWLSKQHHTALFAWRQKIWN